MESAKNQLIVSSSPHIRDNAKTRKIMIEVLIALLPALVAGTVFFGLYALLIVLVSMGSALLGEFLFNLALKRKQTIGDCSALVTGLILGLNLPPAVPIYVPILGGIFATIIVKMLFGGIGKNFANPAAVARIFLLLSFTTQMTTWVAPLTYTGQNIFQEFTKYFAGIGSVSGLDGMTGATPLSPTGEMNVLHMFLGNIGGCIGETSALALIIGGVYLIIRRIVDFKVPLIYLGSFALFTLIFTGTYTDILPGLLGGGLMIGAFFMATDYSTSPNTLNGTILYALGLGFFTVILRQFTNMSEGVSYAIVFMNLLVPLLDKYLVPHFFGSGKKPVLTYCLCGLLAACTLGLGVGAGVSYGLEQAEVRAFYGAGGRDLVYQAKYDTAKVDAVYDAADGAKLFKVTGYKGWQNGNVQMLIAIRGGAITKIDVLAADKQSPDRLEIVKQREFLDQYLTDISALPGFKLGEGIDAASGATATSNAVNNAVNAAVKTYRALFSGEVAA